jgi:hypothetical protein
MVPVQPATYPATKCPLWINGIDFLLFIRLASIPFATKLLVEGAMQAASKTLIEENEIIYCYLLCAYTAFGV